MQKAEQLTHDEKLRLIRHVDWLLHRPDPINRVGHHLADVLAYKDDIVQLAHKHGAYNIKIFGSFARDEAKPDSDIDFLVEFENMTYGTLIALIQDLETLLGRRVDVVTRKGLKADVKTQVIQDAISLCAPTPTESKI